MYFVYVTCSILYMLFQTKYRLYLVLDFVNGGHLFFQLYHQGLFRYVYLLSIFVSFVSVCNLQR